MRMRSIPGRFTRPFKNLLEPTGENLQSTLLLLSKYGCGSKTMKDTQTRVKSTKTYGFVVGFEPNPSGV